MTGCGHTAVSCCNSGTLVMCHSVAINSCVVERLMARCEEESSATPTALVSVLSRWVVVLSCALSYNRQKRKVKLGCIVVPA